MTLKRPTVRITDPKNLKKYEQLTKKLDKHNISFSQWANAKIMTQDLNEIV